MKPIVSLATVQMNDFSVLVMIGTRPEERLAPQDLTLQISFDYDAGPASHTDDLGHAVDYGALHDRIVTETGKTQFLLLESLADFILNIIMEDTRILSASVAVEKRGVFKDVRSVSVKMTATSAKSPVRRC